MINSLARFGYYEQAISVSMGVSSKRKGLPGGLGLLEEALNYILCTYLVPAAIKSNIAEGGYDDGLWILQARSKIAQIRASSSACAIRLGSANNAFQSCVISTTANCMSWAPNQQHENALQSAMAMYLLHQYTAAHSTSCRGLGLNVSSAILREGNRMSKLPTWLTELCTFGLPVDGDDE